MNYIIGIAGGTGSGKTTIAHELAGYFSENEVVNIEFDRYYRDLSHLTVPERQQQNFDHPDSLEIELLVEHVTKLKKGESIAYPTYDFALHQRREDTITLSPSPVIIIEGILTLAYPELASLFDMKIFVDTEADIRFIRRLKRDIDDRGRTFENVIEQYYETVRPMHIEFVEPSKRIADIIIPEGRNDVALETLVATVTQKIKNNLPDNL